MKKVFFLISFLFSVVCFASPPPQIDSGPLLVVMQTDNLNVADYVSFEAPDFAFTFIESPTSESGVETCLFVEEIRQIKLPDVPVQKCRSMFNYKPPLLMTHDSAGYKKNYQHSNYGYPFTGENC